MTKILILIAACLLAVNIRVYSADPVNRLIPASQIIPLPVFPDRIFSIKSYGAIGDAKSLDTDAFNRAILAASTAGGGIVEVPEGRYLTEPFSLTSNIDLKIDHGATILITNDIGQYPMVRGAYENCISSSHCHDVAITGTGTVDGQGDKWWPKYGKGQPAAPHRPYLVAFSRCTRVLVDGVTLQNSPMFHLVPSDCTDVTISNIHINAPSDSPNTDGCDPSGWNYLIESCTFDVGDDCIAIKPSHIQPDGLASCMNFTIKNCTFLHGHGMSIGGQTRGGLNGLIVKNCTFIDTLAGIRMKAPRGAGGLVENVTYDNLTMSHVHNSILITSYYPKIPSSPASDPPQLVETTTPVWRNINISNVASTNGDIAGQIIGLPEMPISNITLSNVRIQSSTGFEIANAKDIRFVKSSVNVLKGPPFIESSSDVIFDKISGPR